MPSAEDETYADDGEGGMNAYLSVEERRYPNLIVVDSFADGLEGEAYEITMSYDVAIGQDNKPFWAFASRSLAQI